MSLLTNLVAYWKLDEASGDAADSSGNSKTLTNVSTVTYAAGLINNGAVFTTGSVNYLERASSDTSFQFDYNTPFSQQLWLKTSTSQFASLMGRQDSQVNGQGYLIKKSDNTATSSINVELYTEVGGAQNLNVIGSTDIVTNTWHHVVMTYSGSGTIAGLKLYINGLEERSSTSGTTIAGTIIGANDEFTLGARELGNTSLTGMLDECAVWSRELSAGEVSSLYGTGSGLPYPLTVAEANNAMFMGANF